MNWTENNADRTKVVVQTAEGAGSVTISILLQKIGDGRILPSWLGQKVVWDASYLEIGGVNHDE